MSELAPKANRPSTKPEVQPTESLSSDLEQQSSIFEYPLTPAAILQLQRTVGNRAVSRYISQRTQTHQPKIRQRPASFRLQRQVLSDIKIEPRPNPANMALQIAFVTDVVIAGRTPSPFPGTMGAHSTAWVAHIDEVRRLLVNRNIGNAALAMVARAREEADTDTEHSLYKLKAKLSTAHQNLLDSSNKNLNIVILAVEAAVAEDSVPKILSTLRALIDAYLTFVNYLPAATVQGGDPSGHGEGSARGEVNSFEYVYAVFKRGDEDKFTTELEKVPTNAVSKKLKPAATAKFAEDGKNSALKKALMTNTWSLFAMETPDIFTGSDDETERLTTWILLLRNFLKTIRRAYPHTFEFLELHNAAQQEAALRTLNSDADNKYKVANKFLD
ncbi:MAG: hypothetical protein U0670_22805, partial [Anaerolineae bacterium]